MGLRNYNIDGITALLENLQEDMDNIQQQINEKIYDEMDYGSYIKDDVDTLIEVLPNLTSDVLNALHTILIKQFEYGEICRYSPNGIEEYIQKQANIANDDIGYEPFDDDEIN